MHNEIVNVENDVGSIYEVVTNTTVCGVELTESGAYTSIPIKMGDILVVVAVCKISNESDAFHSILLHPELGLVSVGHGRRQTIASSAWQGSMRRVV